MNQSRNTQRYKKQSNNNQRYKKQSNNNQRYQKPSTDNTQRYQKPSNNNNQRYKKQSNNNTQRYQKPQHQSNNQRYQNPQQNFKEIPETFSNFCKKKCASLSKDVQQILYTQITQQYGFQQKNNTPLQDIQEITKDYLITINKKNKFPFMLFLTRIQNKNYSIFIYNNKGQLHFYSVKFAFSNDLYNGTLFTGELVKNKKGCWIYYLNDLVYYKNEYYMNDKLSNKIKLLAEIMKSEYEFDEFMNVCHIQIRSYFLFNHLRFITNDCQILFVPEYDEQNIYSYNVVVPKKEVIKTQNNDEKKFKIQKTGMVDVYELYELKTNKFDSIACVNKLKTSRFLKEQFQDKDSFVINTKYSEYFKSWTPIF